VLLWLDNASNEIMAVLPDSGNLLYAILFDKPFPNFQEMAAEDKFKMEMILEKVRPKTIFFYEYEVD
jgi:hypothetical protein